jgi:hypothetical protein
VRGLVSIPDELFHDRWTVHCGVPAVFSDYYATIKIDLSAPYANWSDWVQIWKPVGRAIQRIMLHVTGFDVPQIVTLAEVAYFFSESQLIRRIHKNPLTLAKDRALVLNKGTLPDSTKDTTPDEHILVVVESGEIGDGEQEIMGLVKEMARLGRNHYGADALSREAFRKLVFDWAMGAPDTVLNREQIISRRSVDLVTFPIQQTSYTRWSATQPKSSPKKRRYENRSK